MAAAAGSGSSTSTAIVCPAIASSFGAAIDSLVLSSWPARALKPHEVRLKVHAVALNFFDLVCAEGPLSFSIQQIQSIGRALL
jgi:NADPH:quinone reductase-like Zn-dependent oxidoreductase